jgi:hypothetical protein
MKRSTQVSLILMTAVGVGGVAYAVTPNNVCRQPAPSAVASDTQDCRTRGSGHSSSWHFYGGSGSSNSSTPTSSTTSTSTGVAERGGFGSIGRVFASLSVGS